MKKYVAILALLVSGSVFADPTASVSYQVQQNDNGTQAHMMNYNLSEKLISNISGDLNVNNFQGDSNTVIFTRTDVGLTPNFNIGIFNIGSRFSVGETQSNNKGNWEHYTVEPRVNVELPYDFNATVGYRFRSAFENNVLDTSRTYMAAVGYNITSKDKISLTAARLTGDNGNTANNGGHTYGVTYGHSF